MTDISADQGETGAEFLAARMQAQAESRHPRCWGISSDALALYGLGLGPRPTPRNFPRDPSDLLACELTYDMAPPSVQRIMRPVLENFRTHVLDEQGYRGRVTNPDNVPVPDAWGDCLARP